MGMATFRYPGRVSMGCLKATRASYCWYDHSFMMADIVFWWVSSSHCCCAPCAYDEPPRDFLSTSPSPGALCPCSPLMPDSPLLLLAAPCLIPLRPGGRATHPTFAALCTDLPASHPPAGRAPNCSSQENFLFRM